MFDEVHMSTEPTTRLTHLCGEMIEPLERDENSDVKAIVMLQDGDMGGITMAGYEDGNEGIADLFVHLSALFEAHGKHLMLMSEDGLTLMGGSDGGREDR
jgi:hypothetical protein